MIYNVVNFVMSIVFEKWFKSFKDSFNSLVAVGSTDLALGINYLNLGTYTTYQQMI